MIEKTIKDYLKGALPVGCFLETPASPPNEYVLIEKTGSSNENHISASTIAIQSYSTSLYKASLLNEQIKAAMEQIVELDEIGSSKLNSDYNFTDTTTKKYRYQSVFDVVHY